MFAFGLEGIGFGMFIQTWSSIYLLNLCKFLDLLVKKCHENVTAKILTEENKKLHNPLIFISASTYDQIHRDKFNFECCMSYKVLPV